MSKLILMSGVAGSGKSTYADRYAREHDNFIIISTDDTRYELYQKYVLSRKEEDIVQKTIRDRIIEASKENKNVIFDSAIVKNKSKIKLYNKYKEYFDEISLIILDTSLKECLNRNSKRTRKVPEEVIREMYSYREDITEEMRNMFKEIIVVKE